jgi:hypothetical protein
MRFRIHLVTSQRKITAALLTIVIFWPLGTSLEGAEQAAPQQATLPYTIQLDTRIEVRADRSAAEVTTTRFKVLMPSAIGAVSQQQIVYVEGMQTLDTLEAFTEKADGRRIAVDPANIITRDATSGLRSVFARDLRQRTLIFPDVQVGDTVVMTNRRETRQGLFSGQFMHSNVFPRSQPLADARVIIEAPHDVDLHVGTTGPGLSDRIEDMDGKRRHTVTLSPQPYLPEEARAVSAVDRDPAVLISTFNSYEDIGRAVADAAIPKIVVTPEVSALADEITRGITDRKQQAVAIDRWMKRNIRYVAVYLGLGRVVPNDAATVLKNRFGDCKDKVTLMAALLAAKGITSEPALINLGSAYTLPEPPTMIVLNHLILYLPEFDVYDDPTASLAAFGVLAAEAYDKPVVRFSAGGSRLARTPAMKSDDHVARNRTSIRIAADGTITGQTESAGSGVFGLVLRTVMGIAEKLGTEGSARSGLQRLGTPGTGHIEIERPGDLVDLVRTKASFTLNQRFKAPAPGQGAALSLGLPLAARPGDILFPGPFTGRHSAFSCYAGHEIEDIDVTFDSALGVMPVPVSAITIDNQHFSFRASFGIEGHTFKIHREFLSRVAHQVCPAEVDADIAGPMRDVIATVRPAYAFTRVAPAPPGRLAPHMVEISRAVAAGHKLHLDFLASINPDCTSIGYATVRIGEQPKHGKITVENGTGFTNYPQNNSRSECNKKRSDGVLIDYEPDAGYRGQDSVNLEVIFASGNLSERHYAIDIR